jgi:hypothetical protein
MRIAGLVVMLSGLLLTWSCSSTPSSDAGAPLASSGVDGPPTLDSVADAYVRLVLAVGRHDPNFVDAYYGPPEWKLEAERGAPREVPELLARSRELLARLEKEPTSERRRFLEKQLVAVEGFLRRLSGEPMSLAREAHLLFDIEPPRCDLVALENARTRLDLLLPGGGDLATRMKAARAKVEVPQDRLAAVVDAVLAETRRRTAALVSLPPGEHFEVAFVTGKPWGAYNWYKGGLQSLIEVNTDLPKTLDAVFGTMAHEGYPGHHVYNVLLEDRLVRGRGWRELTVYPLYSPQSLIAEGTANVGSDIIMTEAEQLAFLRDVLAPMAGIAASDVELYQHMKDAAKPLRYAGGEAARMLLEDGASETQVGAFLVRFGTSPERARQNIAFHRTYRSYVFTYTAGQDLVEGWLGSRPDRVPRFFGLLQREAVPSELAVTPR